MKHLLLWVVLFSSGSVHGQFHHWEALVVPENTWRYHAIASDPGSNWNTLNYNDTNWATGAGGFGYGDNDDGTIISPVAAVFLRIRFDVADRIDIEWLQLYADFDDGFIAYLNGTEIGRVNMNPGPANFQQLANASSEAPGYQGIDPLKIDVTRNLIQTGSNILAIQVHNVDALSSDLTSNFYLLAGVRAGSQVFQPLPAWFEPTAIFSSSDLPIIQIETNGQFIPDEPKIFVDLKVINNGPGARNYLNDLPNDYNGKAGIELRGESSQSFPKKSISVETRTATGLNNNVSLLGLPPENDWVLYAPYTDKTFIRDILAMKMGRDMGHYASRTRFAEVVINGSYEGIYVLMEKIKIDKNRLDINQMDPGEDLTGGYIMRVDKWDNTDYPPFQSIPFPEFPGAPYISFQYYDPAGELLTAAQRDYMQKEISRVASMISGNNFKKHGEVIDIPSFIDFMIVNEVGKNIDGYIFSTYLYKDNDKIDSLLHMGPLWDFNLAFGNVDYLENAQFAPGWMYNDQYRMFWFRRLMADPLFAGKFTCRWLELRQTLFTDAYFNSTIDSLVAVVREATPRNYARWPILGTYVWPNQFVGNTYEEEIAFLKSWLRERLEWMDTNLPGNCELVTAVEEENLEPEIYPNPTEGNITIRSKENFPAGTVLEIYSTQGIRVYREVLQSVKEWNGLLDVPDGLYFIRLTNGKSLRTYSVLITK